jgi:hypothetical protein
VRAALAVTCTYLLTALTPPSSASRIAVPWLVYLFYDVLVVGLTLARTWHAHAADSLAHVVRRDGIAYFGAMALVNLANILSFFVCTSPPRARAPLTCLQVFPPQTHGALATLASAVSVTLVSRLCLNIHRPRAPDVFTSAASVSPVAITWDELGASQGASWWSVPRAPSAAAHADTHAGSARSDESEEAWPCTPGAAERGERMSMRVRRTDRHNTREFQDWLAWNRTYGHSKDVLQG